VIYHTEHLRSAQEVVTDHLRKKGGLTLGELRDGLGVSRKYVVALLEHFDNIGLTRREGDRRVLR